MRKNGFTLVEILTVVAIVAILAGILLGLSRSLQKQAEERLAESEIAIIVTALEQYYTDHVNFPFEATLIPVYELSDFQTDIGAASVTSVTKDETDDWAPEALYYFLSRSPNSRNIIETLTDRLISNKDSGGVALTADIDGTTVDLIRFVDPWGEALRYTYSAGDTFPVIESAGADGNFGTGDDIDSI